MTLHQEITGPDDGTTVLCVHGVSANLRSYDGLVGGLAERGLRAVAMDLRGRGKTPDSGPGTYGLDSHVDDLLELGPERFHYVGWSMGALLGLRLADRARDRLISLTLIDAVGSIDPAAIDAVRAGLARFDLELDEDAYVETVRGFGLLKPWDDFWERYVRYEYRRTSRAACEEDLAGEGMFEAESWWPALRDLPTLLIRCTEPLGGGLLVPDDSLARLRSALPGLSIHESAFNHYGVMLDPEVAPAIVSHVAEHDGLV